MHRDETAGAKALMQMVKIPRRDGFATIADLKDQVDFAAGPFGMLPAIEGDDAMLTMTEVHSRKCL